MIKKKPIINLKDKKLFTSIKEGAEFYNVNRNKLSKLCKDKNSQFRFLRVKHGMVLRGKDISKLRKPIKGKIADSRVLKIFKKDELKVVGNPTCFGIFKR